MKIRHALGLDGPVAYTFMARLINILGSTGTVLLIVRFLTPVEQGYYYTLLSLVSLQLVFEMGFSFVIQQLAAHEWVHLELHENGTLSGDPGAHARLASTLQLSLRWYTVAALAMGLILAPLGELFFSRHAAPGAAQVAWQGPWIAAVAASMLGLWCTPFYSFIEGCGQVRAVAAMRLRQAIVLALFAWTAIVLHRGLYAPSLVIVGQTGTGFLFLIPRLPMLLGLLRRPAREATIRWNREVWPFQWRIAVSSMCSYLTVQVFTPIIFVLRGPAEAGKIGMSISVTVYMTVLALAWTSPKATPFGHLIALGQFEKLDRLFLRSLAQSLFIFALIALGACGVAALLSSRAPSLAARMVSPQLFAVLVVAAGANCIVQSLATLLRSFKREPFLIQSLAVAAFTVMFVMLSSSRWGNGGAALTYLVATSFIGLPIAAIIFARARQNYLALHALPMCAEDSA